MYLKSIFRTACAAAVLSGVMFGSPVPAIGVTSQMEVSKSEMETSITAQLKELRSLMSQLNRDAGQLQNLTNSRLHWQTHAYHLTQVKTHVNRVGDKLEALQNLRSSAAPWQRQAIDAVVPIAVQVAERTTGALEHMNEDRHYLWAPEYTDHLRSIPELSGEMHGIVDSHLKIVDAQDKIQDLKRDLAERAS